MRELLEKLLQKLKATEIPRRLAEAEFVTTRRLRTYPFVFLLVYIVVGVWLVAAADPDGTDPWGRPLGTDFMKVYSGGQLVAEGKAEGVYDPGQHHVVQRRIISDTGYYAWHYPPSYFPLARFLAFFSYEVALALFLAVSFLFYLIAIGFLMKRWEAVLIAAAFPGVLVCAGHGQNGFLLAGLFIVAFLTLEKRPTIAGSMLGLATIKPHLGLLFPLGLAAGARWNVFASASLVAFTLGGLSFVIWGMDAWTAFFEHFEYGRQVVLQEGAVGWPKIQSVYAAFGRVGAPRLFGWVVQAIASIAASVAVADVWRRAEAPYEVKFSAAVVGSLVAAPYFLDYDLVMLAVPIALMVKLGLEEKFEPYDKSILVGLWLLPLFARLFGYLYIPITPIALAGTLYWLWRYSTFYESPDDV